MSASILYYPSSSADQSPRRWEYHPLSHSPALRFRHRSRLHPHTSGDSPLLAEDISTSTSIAFFPMIQIRPHSVHCPELLIAMQLHWDVVKFTPTYRYLAREPLEKKLLGTKNSFFVKRWRWNAVCDCDYDEGCRWSAFVPPEAIREAILVFGVLRAPNVIPCEDPMYSKGAVLVDFNWCGRYQHDFIEWQDTSSLFPTGNILWGWLLYTWSDGSRRQLQRSEYQLMVVLALLACLHLPSHKTQE